MGSIVSDIGGAISGAVSGISSGITNFVDQAESTVSDAASSLFSQVSSGFDDVVKGAGSAISSFASGGFPNIQSLFGKLMGGASSSAASSSGGIEGFLKQILAKLGGNATLENGATTNTGSVANRDFGAELQALLAQMQGGTAAATGAATATPAATSTSTASSTGNAGDASSVLANMNSQNTGGTDGLSSYQSNILSGVKDENQRAQMKAQMQMENLTRDASFFSTMAKLMDESLKGIIQNMK